MSNSSEALPNPKIIKAFTDTLIRIGMVAFLVVLCAQVFAPFTGLMLWALILAIALYPLHLKLAGKLGGKPGRAATIIVLSGLLLLGGPSLMIGESFASHLHSAIPNLKAVIWILIHPPNQVAEWPLVGGKVYAAWSAAAENLPAFVEDQRPQLVAFSKKVLANSGQYRRVEF